MRVILIPFAGGSQYSFAEFVSQANTRGMKAVTVEYPGRGKRFKEPLLEDIHDLVEDVFAQVKHQLVPPYAIYGHSMGTIVGYLLAKKIAQHNLPAPFHLFFSGCGGPSIPDDEPPKHLLSKTDFIAKLKELGGCPDAILQDDSMLNIFEPVIRADFKVIELYRYQEEEPLQIPMTIFIGKKDHTTYEEAVAWQRETVRKVDVLEFDGNHFFILGKESLIVDMINKKLRSFIYL